MNKLTNLDLAATHQVTPGKIFLNFSSIPLVFLTLVLTVASVGTPALALKKGDRGPEVAELQKKLQAQGYFSSEITSIYDTATRSAVKKFQQKNDLKVDGIAGRRTLLALQPKSEKKAALPQLSNQSEETQVPKKIAPSPLSNQSDDAKVTPTKQQQESAEKQPATPSSMTLKTTIYGSISPKSVVYSGKGLFFAQNMMYSHTITVYDRQFKLVKTIPDSLNLSDYGFSKFKGSYHGSPVEAAFSIDGKYAYISNYQMYGIGFKNPGNDRCSPAGQHDPSFLYRINTETLKIEKVISVGSVPKFNAISPDNRFVLVSNWCSWDLSVIDTQKNQEIKRVKLGAYPRGIAVDANSENAYVAVMGSSDIAKVNLKNFSVDWLKSVGSSPRHLSIDPAGHYLYATLNGEGKVAKIDLKTGKVVERVATGRAPRSMAIADNGKLLYVVNYFSNTVSKIRTEDMKVLQTVNVNSSPIGITYDPQTKQVWVACYSGSIMVFQD